MKYKSIKNEQLNACKISMAKMIFFGFVLILAFMCFLFKTTKVNAAVGTEIVSTRFDKNSDDTIDESTETFLKVDLTSGTDKLTFIQGTGNDDDVSIQFKISDFPSEATSFMIVESNKTDSSSTADADRYSKELVTDGEGNQVWQWNASAKNVEKNGITGSVLFSESDGKINVDVVYRLRKGSFGMKFIKLYFYNAGDVETKPSSQTELYYVIAQPIDMVNQSATVCETRSETELCIGYDEDASNSRISKDLKIYMPSSVAFKFSVVPVQGVFNGDVNTEVVNNYTQVVNGSTIYGINYFDEITTASGNVEVIPAVDKANADGTYMYTNFTKPATSYDTQEKTEQFINTGNSNYSLYLDKNFNDIEYIATKVDSVGAFTYYLRDIFGNKKEITQDVLNVMNRAVIVEIQKGNAKTEGAKGYNVEENFTNESVKVDLTMTVETHFEIGVCLNDKCTAITSLTSDQVKHVKYWRVDVELNADGSDPDAYEVGDAATKDYAHEKYAAENSMFNIYCKDATVCVNVQNYDDSKKNKEDGAGFSQFNKNVLTMYIGVNGRYRYYVEDNYGNNTWGIDDDRLEEEYRNPRVEVYAIDKAAPEITFEHDDSHETLKAADGTNMKLFDVETYSYYTALELAAANGGFEYDGRIKDTTEAVERNISSQIYYPINRDSGRNVDDKFTDADAEVMAKVRVSDYVYYYDATKDLYSDYSVYDREGTDKYVKKLYEGSFYDNSISTILKNTKHNSNGLKLVSEQFKFNEINYYHYDGVKTVCSQIASIEGYSEYGEKNKLDCVNYYLDHAVDFIIEFVAEDSVGNVGKNRVYVNVIDTTPPGFTLHNTEVEGNTVIDTSKLIKASNIGSKCRMEIGQEIGAGKVQNMASLLNCYNVDINAAVADTNTYNFEDNMYKATVNDGLSFFNRINGNISEPVSHVKLYIKSDLKDSDDNDIWVDLSSQVFVPNKTGYYDVKIIIYDNTIGAEGTNFLTVLVSYYVDRKIVLVQPLENDKFYGENDPGFEYCVYIDLDNHYDIRFSSNPYSDPTIFTKIYCTNQTADEISVGKTKLFRNNTNSDFYGDLSRLESVWYNENIASPNLLTGTSVGVENNYVGLYRFILGTLNIKLNSDETTADDDYIVKVHP